MHSGPLSFLLRLLLACSLVLGGWMPAAAQASAAGTHHHPAPADPAPCHGAVHGAGAAMPMRMPMAMAGGMQAAGHASGHGSHPDTPAHDCCGGSSACLGHCALAGAVPVAAPALPVQAPAAAVLAWPAVARHPQPAPERLIRPPIVS